MPEVVIPQAEADALLALEKHRIDETIHNFPSAGGRLVVELLSPDKRESFLLDVTRSQVELVKGTYQNRARSVVVLARLDFGGVPHRNPDDQEIDCPHIHLYREGFGDKWAFPLPDQAFTNFTDRWQLFNDFMAFVNITHPPHIQRGLFS